MPTFRVLFLRNELDVPQPAQASILRQAAIFEVTAEEAEAQAGRAAFEMPGAIGYHVLDTGNVIVAAGDVRRPEPA